MVLTCPEAIYRPCLLGEKFEGSCTKIDVFDIENCPSQPTVKHRKIYKIASSTTTTND